MRVSDPQLSPDGRLVAYVRTATDPATLARNADIWVVAADGSSAPTPLVAGAKSETTPRWSPDGKQLAFISTRDGEPQIYLASADGSGVRRVTSIAGGVQPPLVWSPDGASLAIVADVTMAQAPPGGAHLMTRLLYRHWDEWRDNLRHHVFVTPAAGGAARDLTPGDFDSPPTQAEDNAVAFTPDGREVVFVSNREGIDREAFTTNNDIWSVPVTGGPARKLTANPAADEQPVFTPDGKFMIVRAQRRPGFESDRWYLDVYDRATGAKRTVFESPDLSVSDFTLAPDGQTILFTAASHAADNLYRVPVGGGTPQQIAAGGSIASAQMGSSFAVFSKTTLTSPAELFRVDCSGAVTPLTHENDAWLKEVEFEKPESASVPGAGGTPIQYWISEAAWL